MRITSRWRLCLIGMFWLCGVTAIAGAQTVAIISGQGKASPGELTIALLSQSLSERPEVRLVERQEVSKLLGEQALGLTGIGDTAAVVRAGKMVAADLFVFIEKSKGEEGLPNDMVRQVTVESRTGVVLDERAASWTAAQADPLVLLAGFDAAQRTTAAPHQQRRYLGLLAIRNAESGTALNGLASALHGLITLDARAIPGVCVLERSRLRRLTEEKQLTDIDQALRASAFLVEGSLRRTGEAGVVRVTLSVKPIAGGDAKAVEFDGRADNVPALRKEITARLALAMAAQARGPADRPTDPAVEAEAFASLGESHYLHRNWLDAVAALDAAVALAPTGSMRLRLLRVLPSYLSTEYGDDRGGSLMQRRSDLSHDLTVETVAAIKAGNKPAAPPPMYERPSRADDRYKPTADEQKWLRELTLSGLRDTEMYIDAYRGRDSWKYVSACASTIRIAEKCLTPQEWVGYLRRRAEEIETETSKRTPDIRTMTDLFQLRRYRAKGSPGADERWPVEVDTWQWLAQRRDPMLRAAALATIAGRWSSRVGYQGVRGADEVIVPLTEPEKAEAITAGAAALRCYLVDLPQVPGVTWRDFQAYDSMRDLGGTGVSLLGLRNDSWDKHILPILREALAKEQNSTAQSIHAMLRSWVYSAVNERDASPDLSTQRLRAAQVRGFLDQPMSKFAAAELQPLREKFQLLSPTTAPAWEPPKVEGEIVRQCVESRYRSDLRPKLTENPWLPFELRRVKTDAAAPVKDADLGGAIVTPDGIVALWRSARLPPGTNQWEPDYIRLPKTRSKFHIQRIDRQGKSHSLESTELPSVVDFEDDPDRRPIIVGDAYFMIVRSWNRIGTEKVEERMSLLMITPQTTRWLTEVNGLPGANVTRIAPLEDGLLVEVRGTQANPSTGLAFYSPKANRFDLLLSSRGAGAQNPPAKSTEPPDKNAKPPKYIIDHRGEVMPWSITLKPGASTDRPPKPGESNFIIEAIARPAPDPLADVHLLDESMAMSRQMELIRYRPRRSPIAGLPPVPGGVIGQYTLTWENAPTLVDLRMAARCVGKSGEGLVLMEYNHRFWVLVRRDKLNTVTLPLAEENALPR